MTCTSPKSCSDSWLEQPPSSRSPGRMKVNDVKMKWEWPLGACVALPWRNLAPAQDFLDMSSPEQGLGRRLASSTTLRCLLLIPPFFKETQSLISAFQSRLENLSSCDTISVIQSHLFFVLKLMVTVSTVTAVNGKKKWHQVLFSGAMCNISKTSHWVLVFGFTIRFFFSTHFIYFGFFFCTCGALLFTNFHFISSKCLYYI